MALSSTLQHSLPPSARMKHLWPIADLLESVKPKQVRTQEVGFRSFVGKANPRFVFYRHCDLLADVLEKVATGEIKRLMVFLPPRHTKSELVSRLFSAYYLLKNPQHFVGINSYAADLAFTLSRAARQNFLSNG